MSLPAEKSTDSTSSLLQSVKMCHSPTFSMLMYLPNVRDQALLELHADTSSQLDG